MSEAFAVPSRLVVLAPTWIENGSEITVRVERDNYFTLNKIGREWVKKFEYVSVMTDPYERHVFLRRVDPSTIVCASYVNDFHFRSWGLDTVLTDHGYGPGDEMVFSETDDPDIVVGDIVDRKPRP